MAAQAEIIYMALFIWACIEALLAWLYVLLGKKDFNLRSKSVMHEDQLQGSKRIYGYVSLALTLGILVASFLFGLRTMGPIASIQQHFYANAQTISLAAPADNLKLLLYIVMIMFGLSAWAIGRTIIYQFFPEFDRHLTLHSRFNKPKRRKAADSPETQEHPVRSRLQREVRGIVSLFLFAWSFAVIGILIFDNYVAVQTNGIAVNRFLSVGAYTIPWSEVSQARLYEETHEECGKTCSGPYFYPHLILTTTEGDFDAWGSLGIGSPGFDQVKGAIAAIRQHGVPLSVEPISNSDSIILGRDSIDEIEGVRDVFGNATTSYGY